MLKSEPRVSGTTPSKTDREGSAWESRPVPQASSLVLALTDADFPNGALSRSHALAQSLGARLHLLRVLPPVGPAASEREIDLVEATRRIQRCLVATRETRIWCDGVLAQPMPVRQLRTRIGDFVDQAVRRATELNAELIVLAPSTGWLGSTATAIARASSRAVLVSRGSPRLTPLLAASDLEDRDFWVLRKAAELGTRLGAPIVAVHNVSCMPWLAQPHPAGAHGSPECRLARAVKVLPSPGLPVLTSEIDPVDAILKQARAHDANTIVVGARHRPWLERLNRQDVAADIVERSDRSVIIVPRTDHQRQAAEVSLR